MNSIIELLSSHRSVRKFKGTPIDAPTFQAIVRAAQCAATFNHVQADTLIQMKDKETRKQIADSMTQINRPHINSFLKKKNFFSDKVDTHGR